MVEGIDYNPYEASVFLGISLWDVRKMMDTGKINYMIKNTTCWIKREELDKIKELIKLENGVSPRP